MKTTTLVVRTSLLAVAAAAAFAWTDAPASAQEKPDSTKKVPYPAAKAQALQAQPPAAEQDLDKEATRKIDKDSAEQILKRDAWFYKQRASADGHIPPGARASALEHQRRQMEAEGRLVRQPNGAVTEVLPQAASITSTWTSIGPTPTTGGIDFSPVTGRITTIAVDPTDATGNTVLIGGAQGGIWRTTDAGATWTAVGDQNASLAMGSIEFAPSAPATVYAGTGEQASIGFDIYYGAGVLKSADHGLTWTQTCTTASSTCPFIGPTGNFAQFGFFTLGGTRISYIAVNPSNANMVLVAAQTQFVEGSTEGVYCTDNGGSTWSNLLSGELSSFVGFTSASSAFVALGNPFGSSAGAAIGNGIYQATSIGATCSTITFSRLTTTMLPAQSAMGRIDIGISPNFATDKTVYASIANSATASNTNLGVFVSTDGGTTWRQTAAPDICQAQCWYDNVIKVDPNGGAHAFFGGSAVTSGGAPIWVERTADTGTTWSTIIPNAISPGLPHVDNHAMAFVKLGTGKIRMYLGNDGGIWRTDDAEATPVVWANLNQSALTLTQFYPALSIHPSNPLIGFGGTQDNGSQNYTGPSTTWTDNQTCGDGTGTAIDNVIPSTVYVTCNGNNITVSSVNGAPASFALAVNGINPADNSDFVPPLSTDPNAADTVYTGTTKVYQSVNAGLNWTALSGDLVNGANQEALTAISVEQGNSRVVYAAADRGQIFVATNVAAGSGTFAVVTGQSSLPPRMVRDIAIDPADTTGKTAYAVFSGFAFVQGGIVDPKGHIFKTTDGGATWTDLSCTVANCSTPAASDLPNTPVNAVVIDPDISGTLYAATDIGVYIGTCSGTPTTCAWSVLSTGLPHVAVLSLKLHRASRTLRAATHGRGMWDNVLNNFTFPGPHESSISPVSANAGSATSVTLTVNGNGFSAGTATVQWTVGGTTTALTTTPGTDSQITATVPTSLLAGAGVATVTVQVGASTSNGLAFVVLGGAPTLTSISPTSTPTQSPPATSKQITLTGTGFTNSSQVLFNGSTTGVTTTFGSSTSLTATLAASLLGPTGSTNDITVVNPPPGGGSSAAATFVAQSAPPSNDNFANATTLTGTSGKITEDTSAATTETSDPILACVSQVTGGGGRNGSFNTVWFKFTPTSNGTLEADTIGSNYDTTLGVFTGSAGALTQVPNACNDDIVMGVNIQSQVTGIPLAAGTTYFIFVGSFGPPDPNPIALGGALTFNFTFTTSGSGGSFTIVVPSATQTITAGTSLQVPITVHPTGTTPPGTVTVTCSGLPPGTTCDPLTINATTTADTTGNLNITVAGPSTTLTAQALPGRHPLPHAAGKGSRDLVIFGASAGFAALVLLVLPGRRRLRAALGLGLVCVASLAPGCGGGGGGGGTVTPVATQTKITLTPPAKQPSTAATFAFSVAVSGGSTPTGSVQLLDGSGNLGSPVSLVSGSATFTENGLTPVGTHAISAQYGGDTGHLTSSSGAINVTVTGSTTIAVAAQGATNGNQTLNVTIN